MIRLITLVFVVIAFQTFGQELPMINGTFQDEKLVNVLNVIEVQTGYRCLYEETWLDSANVTASFQNTPLPQALATALTGTNLNFFILDQRVILTKNQKIIDNPAVLQSFTGEKPSATVEKGLIFSREYLSEQQDVAIESKTIQIGNRAAMKPNGSSFVVGYVRDAETNDPIIGALVYQENPLLVTTTDETGFYSLSLPNGKHQLLVQFAGMKPTQRNIILFSDGKLNIDMNVDVISLQEVTIESDRDLNVKGVQMGVSMINVEEVKTVPIVLGENDILKIATTKPGVQTVGEGASGFNVRGGKADQNLMLINDATVFNPTHFFGFFSSFNSHAIQSMDVYTSGIPANYGGRLSSVFDIHGKKASQNDFKGEGGISPITSRLTVEVPLLQGKAGLLVAGRTTYSNWILQQSKNANFKDNKVSFYDLQTQLDYRIDKDNDLRLSAYLSSDQFRLSSDTLFSFSNFGFKNTALSGKWTHRFNSKFEGNLSAIYSAYSYEVFYEESSPNAFKQNFGIGETTLKTDFSYYFSEQKSLQFGASTKRYEVNPGTKTPYGDKSIVPAVTLQKDYGLESALYAAYKHDLSKKLTLSGGLRYAIFSNFGPKYIDIYREGAPLNADTRIDSVYYGSGKAIKTYHGPEWRFSTRYSLNPVSSLKFSATRTRQYIHTLSNSASLSPTDTWIVSGPYLKPQVADQVALGYYRNLFRSTLEFTVEGYYKWLQNLVDFKTGSEFLLNEHVEREILQGRGKSYGVEFSLTKSGRLNGWLNYTYARTFIQLDGASSEEKINSGKYFRTSYDKPHTINMVANYKLTRRLSFSLNASYYTGRPVTVPVAAYDYKGTQSLYFSDRNAYRIPDYFRTDLGINLEGNHKMKKLSHSFWSLSVYNLTGRDNPYSVFFDLKNGKIQGSQLIVFGSPIPTLTYNFKF